MRFEWYAKASEEDFITAAQPRFKGEARSLEAFKEKYNYEIMLLVL